MVKVVRGTLTEETAVKGELGYGPEVPLPVKASGTVTWLPQRGASVKRGEAVLRVDDRPVALLYGALPMYRDMSATASDSSGQSSADGSGGGGDRSGGDGSGDVGRAPAGTSGQAGGAETAGESVARGAESGLPAGLVRGADVQQFERNLAALGYTGFTVDDMFSVKTAQAVKQWQKALGMPETGIVKAGDVVYAGGPIRVARTGVQVGSEVSAEAVSYSSASRMVTVAASAADMAWAQRGNQVTVELPGGVTARGKVSSVGADASPAGDSGGSGGGEGGGAEGATVPVVIIFADQKGLGRLESGPVTVRYVGREQKDVLTVPVVALVALAEGGYGLEPADKKSTGGQSARGYVAVTTGLVADGRAEVSGPGVREGMTVRIPK
ncbi:peptidoglycan-binding domain-containing protein [Streptomyces phaeoluteigriseus]|uniref:peptidoglycan-binding domain-containing protein n=1 Tax=Streptomyces phaeoluteigriseus TaxID=114686 RepID=UPI000926D25E|nr:peptidoglycan-binding domain-containing protein [Streptomyces phaeoluteigriseus]